jgi:hypothetical protein
LPNALETAPVTRLIWNTLLTAASGVRIHSDTVRRVPSGCASELRLRPGAASKAHTMRHTTSTTRTLPAGIVIRVGRADGRLGGRWGSGDVVAIS